MSPPVIEPVSGAVPAVEYGDGTTWVDISCYVHEIELAVGRDRSMQRWEVGSCGLVVDNSDGWADLAQGPPPAELTIRPGRHLRVGMALDGGPVRWMWRGFIDSAEPSYDSDHHDITVLAGIDAKGEAGKVDLARVEPTVGGGETASARIGRILDAVAWPGGQRDIAPTAVTLLATDLAGRAADLLDVSAESAGGAVFGDARGMVVFKPRDWQTFVPGTPVDGTIGNTTHLEGIDVVFDGDPLTFDGDPLIFGEGLADDVCPTSWDRSFNRADIATRTVVGRRDGPGRTFDDFTNQARYGIETLERTDLIAATDGQLDVLGQRWLKVLSADYMPRVEAVTIDPASSIAARDLAATVDPTIPSRYRCRHHRGGVAVFDAEFFATGVRHTISREDWICRITLDAAGPFSAVGARWEEGQWDQALWGSAVLREGDRVA